MGGARVAIEISARARCCCNARPATRVPTVTRSLAACDGVGRVAAGVNCSNNTMLARGVRRSRRDRLAASLADSRPAWRVWPALWRAWPSAVVVAWLCVVVALLPPACAVFNDWQPGDFTFVGYESNLRGECCKCHAHGGGVSGAAVGFAETFAWRVFWPPPPCSFDCARAPWHALTSPRPPPARPRPCPFPQ